MALRFFVCLFPVPLSEWKIAPFSLYFTQSNLSKFYTPTSTSFPPSPSPPWIWKLVVVFVSSGKFLLTLFHLVVRDSFIKWVSFWRPFIILTWGRQRLRTRGTVRVYTRRVSLSCFRSTTHDIMYLTSLLWTLPRVPV